MQLGNLTEPELVSAFQRGPAAPADDRAAIAARKWIGDRSRAPRTIKFWLQCLVGFSHPLPEGRAPRIENETS